MNEVVGILIGLGGFMIGVGWHGRRAGTEPVCRRCQFNLTGLPVGGRCPECGAGLGGSGAVQYGSRVRRRGVLALAVGILVPCISWAGFIAFLSLRENGIVRYEPAWLLVAQVSTEKYAPAEVCSELQIRLEGHRLRQWEVGWVADKAIGVQDRLGVDHRALKAAAGYLETAFANKELDGARAERFFDFAIKPGVTVRPIVRQGDVLPISIDVKEQHLKNESFCVYYDFVSLKVDGITDVIKRDFHGDYGHFLHLFVSANPWPDHWDLIFDKANTDELPPGRHTLTAVLKFYAYNVRDVPDYNESRGGPSPDSLLISLVRRCESSFDVYDAAHEPTLLKIDPKLRAAVKASVTVERVFQGKWKGRDMIEIPVEFSELPTQLCFVAAVRPAGKEQPIFWAEGYNTAFSAGGELYTVSVPGNLGDVKFVDVYFVPNPNGFRNSVRDVYVWGEDIEFLHVPLVRR